MLHTKNDLCADTATLDLAALERTAKVAYFLLIEEIDKNLKQIRENIDSMRRNLSPSHHYSASRILDWSKELTIVDETYRTLVEAKLRQEIKVIKNKDQE